jgi:hypothetical protein
LEEKTPPGYVKALLVVAHLFSSPVEQISEHDAKKLVRHIYQAVFGCDDWANFPRQTQEFANRANQTQFAEVLGHLAGMSRLISLNKQ